MPTVLVFLFLITSSNLIESRDLPTISSFYKEIIVKEHTIIPSEPAVKESGSIAYAICNRTDYHFSSKKYCNVTVETSTFSNISNKNSCLVSIAPDETYFQTLSRFTILFFTENKIILYWEQEDDRFSTKSIVFKILKMRKCELVNVIMPTDQLSYVIMYKNKFDLILSDKEYCGSPSCKITLNENGKRINFEPISILTNLDIAFQSGLGAVSPAMPYKGFYTSVILNNKENMENHYEHLFRVYRDGKAITFDQISLERYVSFSNSYEYFSVCEYAEGTTVMCRQYDTTLTLKINATFEFQDGKLNRWMQPFNLEDGSLLLITGTTNDLKGRRYDNFDVIKVDPDGRKDRPLVIEALNLKCKRSENLRVYVIENESDQICFYFVCRQGDEYRFKLKFSVKCLPSTTFTMVKHRIAILS